jgi:hypothetical protein
MFVFNLHMQLMLKRYSILNPASFIDCKVLSCRGCIKNCEHVCLCVYGLLDEGRNCIRQCDCVTLSCSGFIRWRRCVLILLSKTC